MQPNTYHVVQHARYSMCGAEYAVQHERYSKCVAACVVKYVRYAVMRRVISLAAPSRLTSIRLDFNKVKQMSHECGC